MLEVCFRLHSASTAVEVHVLRSLFSVFFVFCALTQSTSGEDRPLFAYVAKEDASYRWELKRDGKVGKTNFWELQLTSQTWQGIAWKHQLFLIKPSQVQQDSEHGMLFIGGGSWRDPTEESAEEPATEQTLPREASQFALLAEQLHTPVAVLLQVPHQPVFGGKYEDQIIAYTFAQFHKTGDVEWPLLLPMVKSAVRAMDATSEFSQSQWSHPISTFTVSGASKRGWTTWLTGAVDKRATAIAPMVIDVLNMSQQMKHQKEVWGDFSYKIADYTELGLTEKQQTERGQALERIVDPFSYRKLLSQPKLIILGTNDHYWPLDALNLYWDELESPKHILYVPNNRHGLSDLVRVFGGLNALHQSQIHQRPLPELSWNFTESSDGVTLEMNSVPATSMAKVWYSESPTRDFRKAEWRSFPTRQEKGTWSFKVSSPESGYVAVFGEATYALTKLPFYLSTNVRIIKARTSDSSSDNPPSP